MGKIANITLPDGNKYDVRATAIPYGECDSTSTETAFTVTVPGITELTDGTLCYIRNNVITSAKNCTLNVNGLGAKPIYSSLDAASRSSTIFNINYTMMFIYNESRVSGGCWDCFYGYDSNTNTLGYQLRTNSTILKTTDATRYYRIFFTSADGTHWVPSNTGTDKSATSIKTVNQKPIDPFGRIVYTSADTSYAAEDDIAATTIWDQYALVLGYSFNRTGSALTLTEKAPVYIKCAPQSNGSAIIDSTTPYVQTLPTNDDGKIYIFLGVAYDATHVEMTIKHPVYCFRDGGIRQWTNGKTYYSEILEAPEVPIDVRATVTGYNPDNGTFTSFTIDSGQTKAEIFSYAYGKRNLRIFISGMRNNKVNVFTLTCSPSSADSGDARFVCEGTELTLTKISSNYVWLFFPGYNIPLAEEIAYDPESSGLSADNVQGAIDEVYGDIPSNLSDLENDVGYITEIDSADVTTALGFTPYNATNPSSFISAADIPVTDVKVNGTTILSSGIANFVTNTAYDASSNKFAMMADLSSAAGGTTTVRRWSSS